MRRVAITLIVLPSMCPFLGTPAGCARAGFEHHDESAFSGDADSQCGDGTIDPGEQCDDLNRANGDGCTDECRLESGWVCGDTPSLCRRQETLVVAPLYPTAGRRWNDYVRADGTTRLTASDTACVAGVDTACMHAGIHRAATLTLTDSCTGLTARDSGDVFYWECHSLHGRPTLVNTGFQPEKGLAALLQTTDWLPLSLTVFFAGNLLGESVPARWWNNPVAPLPENAMTGVLVLDESDDDGGGPDQSFTEGTIFTLPSDRATRGYNLNGHKLAVVTLGNATLAFDGVAVNCNDPQGEVTDPNFTAIICAGHQDYLWLETRTSGSLAYGANVYLTYGRFIRVHRTISAGGWNGLQVERSDYTTVTDSMATNTVDAGITMWNDAHSVLSNVQVTNAGSHGVWLWYGDLENNILTQIHAVFNAGSGVAIEGKTTLAQLTAIGNQSHGLSLSRRGPSTASDVLLAGNGGDGVLVAGALGNLLSDVTVTDNLGAGVHIGDTFGGQLNGALRLSNNGAGHCLVETGATSNLPTGEPSCGDDQPGLSVVFDFDLSASFVGLVATDTVNPAGALLDTNGRIDYALITDWLSFATPYRAWGPPRASPLAHPTGRCSAPTCALFDLAPTAVDTRVRDALGPLQNGLPCPPAASVVVTDLLEPPHTFLRHAVELFDDAFGNDNGLCENGEACVYSAHLGAYQGAGDRREVQCDYAGGSVTDVILYAPWSAP